jgi:hypothetical protein
MLFFTICYVSLSCRKDSNRITGNRTSSWTIKKDFHAWTYLNCEREGLRQRPSEVVDGGLGEGSIAQLTAMFKTNRIIDTFGEKSTCREFSLPAYALHGDGTPS